MTSGDGVDPVHDDGAPQDMAYRSSANAGVSTNHMITSTINYPGTDFAVINGDGCCDDSGNYNGASQGLIVEGVSLQY